MISGTSEREMRTSDMTQQPGAGMTWEHLHSQYLVVSVSMYSQPLHVTWASSRMAAWDSRLLTWLLWTPGLNVQENKVKVTGFFFDRALKDTHDHIRLLSLTTGESWRTVQFRISGCQRAKLPAKNPSQLLPGFEGLRHALAQDCMTPVFASVITRPLWVTVCLLFYLLWGYSFLELGFTVMGCSRLKIFILITSASTLIPIFWSSRQTCEKWKC